MYFFMLQKHLSKQDSQTIKHLLSLLKFKALFRQEWYLQICILIFELRLENGIHKSFQDKEHFENMG